MLLNTRRATTARRETWLELGYGSWQQTTMQGGFNLPFSDTAALRVAARSESSSDGWQQSIGTGAIHGEKDNWDVRTWLHFEPTAALALQWKIQSGHDASDIPLGRSIGMYARSGIPTLCAAVLAGQRDDANCINFGGVNRLRRNKSEVPEQISLQAQDGSAIFADPLSEQRNDYVNSVLDVTLALQGMELRAITSLDNFGYGVALDLDGSQGEYGHRISNSDIRVLSQELRLVSATDAPLQWLLGVALSAEDFEEGREFNLRENTLVPLYRGIMAFDQNTKSSAVYADLEYQLDPQWSINTNLRYTNEDKEYRNGNLYIPLASPIYLTRQLQADYSLDSHFSGGVALNWVPDATLLGYAKLSRGFKSGGFYGGFPFSQVEVEPYLEETITAIEFGFKKSIPAYALQLNGAVFHYEYEDVQGFIQTINPLTNTGIDRLANQGDAEHDGIELQMQWHPEQRIGVQLGLAWLNAEFVSTGKTTSNLLKQQVAITGRRPYAPEWSGNVLVNFRQVLNAGTQLDWTLAYDYRSEFSGNQSVPAEEAVNHLSGYGLFNAGIELYNEGLPWRGRVWLRNLTDLVYRTRVKSDGLNSYMDMFGEPRSIGIDIEYRL